MPRRSSKVSLRRVNWIQVTISYVLRLTLLIAVGAAVLEGLYLVAFLSALIYIFTFLPSFIMRRIDVNLPLEIEFIVILFIYAALFLGEVHSYYALYPWWDIALHTISSVILGFVGFLIIYIMYRADTVSATPLLMAAFAFSFALAIGALWEIFEFGMDQLFGMNMQKSGIVDTMTDLIVDACGALLVSIAGYFYMKGRFSFFFHRLLLRFAKANPHLFGKD